MTTQTPAALLAEELAAVRGELVRIDAKCSTFASVAGIALGFVLTASVSKVAPLVLALLALAAVPLLACVLVLLARVLCPRLGSSGFPRFATMEPEAIHAELKHLNVHGQDAHRARELVVLSGIALAKSRALRLACALLGAGLALVVVAIVAGVAS